MSENNGSETYPKAQTDWNEHYNQADAAQKVADRRKVYDCLEPGEKPIRFDSETLEAAEMAGLSSTARVVDIGCSYPPYDLERWHKQSFKMGKPYREFLGVEPNTGPIEHDGRRYWQPEYPVAERSSPTIMTSEDNPFNLSLVNVIGKAVLGVEIIKSDANNIPLADGSVDLATFMFSFYHIEKGLQRLALHETRRVLKKVEGSQTVNGMLALSTSGNENKAHMRQNEILIARQLSKFTGVLVTPPEPLNSGFTSEDAELLLPEEFLYVYKFEYLTDIVVKNEEEEEIIRKAYRTLRDKYTDQNGNSPTEEMFEDALRTVVDREFEAARALGVYPRDNLSQALFFASDRPLNLDPVKYKRIFSGV